MVLNKFAFLTRQGLGKTLTHVPQTFVAGTQSSYASSTSPFAPFGNHASGKFGKAGNSHLHTSFQGPSSPATVQSKAAQANGNNGEKNDSGLAAYYDAWQKQHQPGTEEKEWKQYQFAKRIGWKPPTAAVRAGRAKEREEVGATVDARLERGILERAYSTSAVDDIKKSTDVETEVEALASVDKAIAKEISKVKESAEVENHAGEEQPTFTNNKDFTVIDRAVPTTPTIPSPKDVHMSNNVSLSSLLATQPDTMVDSGLENPDSILFSKQITALRDAGRYADIPPSFEEMLSRGMRPTMVAYNGLLAAAMSSPMGKHSRVPTALDIWTHALQRNIYPDAEFHGTLIQLLAERSLYVSANLKSMDQQSLRLNGSTGESQFLFKSKDIEYKILTKDNALLYAIQMFKQAEAVGHDRFFSASLYHDLITACAANGETTPMTEIYTRMEDNKIVPNATMYPPMIEALGANGDLASVVLLYKGYKDLAIASNAGDLVMEGRQDNEVYAALVKAYARCGRIPGAEKFLGKVLQSYVPDTEHRQEKIKATQDTVLVDGFVQQSLDAGNFADALKLLEERALTDPARDKAFARISIAAADYGITDIATSAFNNIQQADSAKLKAATALLALHLRKDEIDSAREFWSLILGSSELDASFTEPAASYATALVFHGSVDEALTEAREAFVRLRRSAVSRTDIVEEIDEAIEVIGSAVRKQGVIPSGPAAIGFLRAMMDNRGLVSPVAEQMLAGLGFEEILSLNPQDLTLALQVQADILAHGGPVLDIGHTDRFAHLIRLITTSRILPEQHVSQRVERAAEQISSERPELLAQWQDYQRSFITPPYTPVPFRPQPSTPITASRNFPPNYDPYDASVDLRGSNGIIDQLDYRRSGPLAALNESVLRVYNMRRVGRHPTYTAYSRLITAAAKEKRVDIVEDVHAMAKQDVPVLLEFPAVVEGWTLIWDTMVAAYLSVGKRSLAVSFHQELLNIGSAPSANTFGLYITTIKESTKTFDEATEAVSIFQQAQSQNVKPTCFLYNALLGKLGKARRIDDCLQYFTEMRQLGVRPSSVTYGTVVNACCRVSDGRMAEDLFEEMESQSNYNARPAPYNTLMQFFLNIKHDSAKVLEYYERMKAQGIIPTMHTYKLLIDTYATLDPVNLDAAEGVLQTIRAAGRKPEAVHYASLIHAKGCNLKDMDGAMRIFKEVMAKREVTPQACLYQALFESMVANHNVAAAEPLLNGMASNGVEMTAYIANTLIHGWANEKNLTKAQAIYDSMGQSKREPSTYEAMTRAYLTNGNRAGAIDVVNNMKSKRYPSAVESKVLDLLGPNASSAGPTGMCLPQSAYAEAMDTSTAL